MRQSGWLLYRLQRAHVDYHFSKFEEKGIAALAATQGAPGNPERARAYRNYTTGLYGDIWGDEDGVPYPPHAARELLEASRTGRAPEWVLALISIADVRKAGER